MRKNLAEATGPRKGPIDVIRVALWYSAIELYSGLSSAYAVERKIEPEAFGLRADSGRTYHRNKFARYRVGQSRPNRKLIERAERMYPGTAGLYNHLLWEFLRETRSSNWLMTEGLRKLPADIQALIFEAPYPASAAPLFPRMITKRTLQAIERHAGIDALAGLSILLQSSLETGANEKMIALLTDSLRRVLVVTCSFLPFSDFSGLLFYAYVHGVLSVAPKSALSTELSSVEDFMRAKITLQTGVMRLEDAYLIGLDHRSSVRGMLDILDGQYELPKLSFMG